MVCRSVPGASVPIALARLDSDLDDPQVQSLMHQLRHECPPGYASRAALEADTIDDDAGLRVSWARLRQEMITAVRLHPVLGPSARTLGMTEKLRGAHEVPPADLQHACRNIRARAVAAATQLDQTLRATAIAHGIHEHEVRARFEELRAAAPHGRTRRPTTDERERWSGLPLDPATRYALTHLDTNPDQAAEAGPPVVAPEDWHPVHDPQGLVQRYGYDPTSRRLELALRDGRQLAYRNVPARLQQQLADGAQADAVWQSLRRHSRHRYPTTDVAEAYAVRRRCSTCGQFASLEHRCQGPSATAAPVVIRQAAPAPMQTRTVTLPEPFEEASTVAVRTFELDDLVDQLEDTGLTLEVPLTAGADEESAYVTGHALVQMTPSTAGDEGDSLIAVRAGNDLGCSCYDHGREGECDHVSRALTALRSALHEHRLARAHRVGDLADQLADRHRRGRPTLPDDDPTSRCSFHYRDDPALFATHVRAALQANDEERVPWRHTRTTDTIVGDGVSPRRQFGVELEWAVDPWARELGDEDGDDDLPGVELLPIDEDDEDEGRPKPFAASTEVLHLHGERDPDIEHVVRTRVGSRLMAAELTVDTQQREYGAKRREGYEAGPFFTWSYEADGSVDGGEVVSPILSDAPEDWRALRTACLTITAAGGIADATTGSHVTISSPEFAGDADRINRLLAVVQDYESTLGSMAAAGHNRTTAYATPLDDRPAAGFLSVSHAKRTTDRQSAVNIQHVPSARPGEDDSEGAEDDGCRVEIRLWDGSLDPGRIQAQVAVSVALVDYASRTVGQPVRRPAQHHNRPAVAPDDPAFAEATAEVRELLDALATSDVQKQQFTALWAAGAYRPPEQVA